MLKKVSVDHCAQDDEESGKSSPRQSDRLISKSIPLTDVEWGAVSPGWGEGVRDC